MPKHKSSPRKCLSYRRQRQLESDRCSLHRNNMQSPPIAELELMCYTDLDVPSPIRRLLDPAVTPFSTNVDTETVDQNRTSSSIMGLSDSESVLSNPNRSVQLYQSFSQSQLPPIYEFSDDDLDLFDESNFSHPSNALQHSAHYEFSDDDLALFDESTSWI